VLTSLQAEDSWPVSVDEMKLGSASNCHLLRKFAPRALILYSENVQQKRWRIPQQCNADPTQTSQVAYEED